jgi:hypothetical protein
MKYAKRRWGQFAPHAFCVFKKIRKIRKIRMKYAWNTHEIRINRLEIRMKYTCAYWVRKMRMNISKYASKTHKYAWNTQTCYDAFLIGNRVFSMDGAWSTQTRKRQCHATGNWKGDYPWGLQACWSRIISTFNAFLTIYFLIYFFCHLWVGARCFQVGTVLFVSIKCCMQSEDAQAIFVGASETNEAGSSWLHSFHFAQKENCRQ